MKQFLRLFLFILLAGISVTACREDRDDFIPYEDTKITTTISGFVADEAGNVISNANVVYKDKQTLTDDYGFFNFENVEVKNQAFITVEKSGYFEGSRTIFPREGKRQWIRIHLLQKSFDTSFSGSTGGEIQSDGIKILFPASAIIDANGNTYTGNVSVALKYLDPSKANTSAEMPGALMGISDGGLMQSMASFSMIAVELKGDAGQKLNLGNDKKAKITFPIPADFVGSAPGSIPLWYFDQTLGFWKEEGKATKIGSTYQGEVGHFSFWNCDAPFEFIHLSGSITDPNGNPISQIHVRLTRSSNGMAAGGYTNADGVFEGKVPKDETFLMEVLDNCNNVVYTTTIGPFSIDTDLPAIQLTASSYLVSISGTVVDCDLAPIDSARVIIKAGGYNIMVFADDLGQFSTSLFDCSANATVTVKGIDLDNLVESDLYSFPTAPVIDAGNIETCSNPLDEYINYTIVGYAVAETLITPNYTDSSGMGLYVSAGMQTPNGFTEFSLASADPMALGTINLDGINIYKGTNGSQNSFHGTEGTITLTSIVTGPGTYLIGTFDATNVTGPGGPYTVTGSFRVKGQ